MTQVLAKKLITSIKEYAREFKKQGFYNKKNLEKTEVEESPCGKYELTIESFKTGKGTWNYTRGTVRNKATEDVIAVVDRNYHSFWRCWADNHPDGHDYLLCGENYQGQTIIRLDDPERIDYLPKSAEKGVGFCWADVQVSPDKTIIAVEGCYWACPYEVRFYDFTEPMKHPVDLASADGRYDRLFGWKDATTAIVGYEEEIRKSDGMNMDELYELDEDAADKAYDEDDIDYRDVKTELKLR